MGILLTALTYGLAVLALWLTKIFFPDFEIRSGAAPAITFIVLANYVLVIAQRKGKLRNL